MSHLRSALANTDSTVERFFASVCKHVLRKFKHFEKLNPVERLFASVITCVFER